MTKTMKVNTWEAAWDEYINALQAFDQTFANRHKPRCVRQHNANKQRLGEARKVLASLDASFVERNGWN